MTHPTLTALAQHLEALSQPISSDKQRLHARHVRDLISNDTELHRNPILSQHANYAYDMAFRLANYHGPIFLRLVSEMQNVVAAYAALESYAAHVDESETSYGSLR